MTKISELLSRDLDQKIVEVIQVDQTNEVAVRNEIEEYVVTDRIRGYYEELLGAFIEAKNNPDQSSGVWVSGFFGSGKSSFAKNLGYILENSTLLGEPAAEVFKQRSGGGKLNDLIDSVNLQLPTRVIMFDVIKDRSQTGTGNLSIAPFIYRVLLRELGYAEDFGLAELEIQLEHEGRLQDFMRRYDERYSTSPATTWVKQGRKGAESWNRAAAILHEMDPETYPTPESFAYELVRSQTQITPRMVVDRAFELMARREPGKSLALIIDEVGQYVAYSEDRLEDLRAIVEEFGHRSYDLVKNGRIPGPAWLVVTSQERLEEVTSALGTDKRVLLAKVRDRFKYTVDLSPADIREVATRRVLGKNNAGEWQLRSLFGQQMGLLNNAVRLEKTKRSSDLQPDDFVQFYPYLPHYIDLSIDIMSGVRLKVAGAMRQLGGSNRTIISQVYQMLVNPRTNYAERDLGALVALDSIYELIEAQVGSTRQKEIEDVRDRFRNDAADGGWAVRVAKAITLLMFVNDLPRSDGNLAALLVDRVGQQAPLPEVQAALARLETGQFVRNTESGWTLQTAQEKNWEQERRGFVPRPRDRNEIMREMIDEVFNDQKLRNHRFGNKTFKIGVSIDGARAGDPGDVPLDLLMAEDGAALAPKRATAVQDSRQTSNQNNIYWVFALDPEIDERVARLYSGREMINKYGQVGAQNQLAPELAPSLANEKTEVEQVKRRLKDALENALKAGQGVFRGVARDAAQLGRTPSEMFSHLYDWALPDLYPKLEMGTRPLRGKETDELLKTLSLQTLGPVFFAPPAGFDLITKEGSRYVPNKEAPIAKELLDYLARGRLTGKELENKFGGIGYGWDIDVLQLVLAVLLRAGAIQVTYRGRTFRNHQDPQSREPFLTIPAFRNASFAPGKVIDIGTLAQAATALEDLTGEEVDVEESAIDEAFKRLAGEELRLLLPAIATARANDMPVYDALDDYRATLENAQASLSDDLVLTLYSEGKALKDQRREVQRILSAINDNTLAVVRRARGVLGSIWPVLRSRPEGRPLAEDAETLRGLITSPDFYSQLNKITANSSKLQSSYEQLYQDLHRRRFVAFSQAIKEARAEAGDAGLLFAPSGAVAEDAAGSDGLSEDVWADLVAPLASRICPPDAVEGETGAADLGGGAVECRHCRATPGQMESDLIALLSLKAQVATAINALLPKPEPAAPDPDTVERISLQGFFRDPISSEQDVENAVDRLRDHLLDRVTRGLTVVLE